MIDANQSFPHCINILEVSFWCFTVQSMLGLEINKSLPP